MSEARVHCRALTMCSRSSCTMPVNCGRERHFEIARARQCRSCARPGCGPGRADITKMRSARNTASRRSWVTSTIGDLARRMQVADHAPQLLAREGVERAERLVQHQQFRLVDQRAAERGALLHAAGQFPRDICCPSRRARPRRAAPRRARHIRPCGGGSGCGAAARSRAAAAGFPASCARAAASAPGTPCRRSSPAARPAVPATCDRALEGKLQPGRELHQGGLAAAGRADHRGEFAAVDVRWSGPRPQERRRRRRHRRGSRRRARRKPGSRSRRPRASAIMARSVRLAVGCRRQERGVEDVGALRLGVLERRR